MSHDGSRDSALDRESRPRADGSGWRNLVITVLLLAVVAIVGVAAYDARTGFWDAYLAFKAGK